MFPWHLPFLLGSFRKCLSVPRDVSVCVLSTRVLQSWSLPYKGHSREQGFITRGGREAVGARGDAHTTSTARNQGTHACWDSAHFPPSARIQPRGQATHSGQVSSPHPSTNQDIQLLGDSRVCRSDITLTMRPIYLHFILFITVVVCVWCVWIHRPWCTDGAQRTSF